MLTSADILRTLFTFFISGVLGALFERWLSRARPKFVITSIGFQGSSKLIKVPEKLISISEDSIWLDPVMPYESFNKLIQQHKYASEIIQKLKKASPMSQAWLKENQDVKSDTLSLAEVKKHPCMNDRTIAQTFARMIRRNELRDIPVTLVNFNHCEQIAELHFVDGGEGWHLLLGSKNVVFSIKDISDKNHHDDMSLCAESFSRGFRKNIVHYTISFVRMSDKEINMLTDYMKLLEEILLPESRLFAELSIHNSGQSAIAIRPHMGLKILHESLEKKSFILTIQKNHQNERDGEMQTVEQKTVGREVVPESFLPETSASPYISIPPGGMQEVTLIASESLGKEKGEIVKTIYQTGLLKCKIVGQTISGKAVWSTPAIFSNNITDGDKASIEKIILNDSVWNNLRMQ